MEGYGLEEIDDTGKEFDPNIHVAIETEETKEEKDDHKISKTIQKGYKRGNEILRPAKVSVYEYKK